MKICPLMSLGSNKTSCAGHLCALWCEDDGRESGRCGFAPRKLEEIVNKKVFEQSENSVTATEDDYDTLFPPTNDEGMF